MPDWISNYFLYFIPIVFYKKLQQIWGIFRENGAFLGNFHDKLAIFKYFGGNSLVNKVKVLSRFQPPPPPPISTLEFLPPKKLARGAENLKE